MGKEGWAFETDEAVALVAAVVALASAAVRRVDGEGFFKFVVFVLCWAESWTLAMDEEAAAAAKASVTGREMMKQIGSNLFVFVCLFWFYRQGK